jgi:hypothetical protein
MSLPSVMVELFLSAFYKLWKSQEYFWDPIILDVIDDYFIYACNNSSALGVRTWKLSNVRKGQSSDG